MIDILDEQKGLLEAAIRTYGIDNQLDVAVEEMAELTKAICKHNRYWRERDSGGYETVDSIREECADVCIMMAQVRILYDEDAIDEIIDAKLDRLAQRIGYEEE